MKSVKEIIKEELGKIKNNLPVLEGENSKKLSKIRDLYLRDLIYEISYQEPFFLAHLSEFNSNNPFLFFFLFFLCKINNMTEFNIISNNISDIPMLLP